jgi:hypothetical protein
MSTWLPGDATTLSGRYAAADHGVGTPRDGPMVMFLRRKYIASEADGTVCVEVIRVGDSSQQCSVYFSTASIGGISSASEHDYVAIKDKELIFPAGETLQAVNIEIVNNDRWEEVELFRVVLEHPHNARLGPLASARVAIADDDLYPKSCQTSGWGLIKAFIQEQIAERGAKFWKTVAALSYIGMFSTIDALILKLVIDNALGQAPSNLLTGGSDTAGWTTPVPPPPSEDEEVDIEASPCGAVEELVANERHPKLAIWLACSYLVFFAISHKCDVMQLDFRGRSGTRKWLRNSLITRFMHMSERGIRGRNPSMHSNRHTAGITPGFV